MTDTTDEPTTTTQRGPTIMNAYERKQEERRERYEEQAEKARRESQQRYDAASEIARRRPFGQPILVGHHSEKSARADQRRIDSHMHKSIEAQQKAEHYDRKAKAVGQGGISSDDPDAIDKLRTRLGALEARHERMKLVNRMHRAYVKDEARGERLMEKNGLTDEERVLVRAYEPPYSWEPHPHPPYRLKNSLANIKRIRRRIERLEARSTRETTTEQIGAVEIVENVEANRVQLVFPDKPSAAVRDTLKRHGFRWSRRAGAWQRHLTPSAVAIAHSIAQETA